MCDSRTRYVDVRCATWYGLMSASEFFNHRARLISRYTTRLEARLWFRRQTPYQSPNRWLVLHKTANQSLLWLPAAATSTPSQPPAQRSAQPLPSWPPPDPSGAAVQCSLLQPAPLAGTGRWYRHLAGSQLLPPPSPQRPPTCGRVKLPSQTAASRGDLNVQKGGEFA